jgi:parallel beta-helix repeat protein
VGIQLEHSNDNEIKENRIEEAGDIGISLLYANNNTIEENEITESIGFGIEFRGSWDNIISRNNFIHNRCLTDNYDECSQAFSDSVNEISHNYWDDWTNPDQNYDCIVDNPYILEGAREFDFAPLTIPFADHNSNIFCEFMEAIPPIIKNNIPLVVLGVILLLVILIIIRKRIIKRKLRRGETQLLYPSE